MANADERQHKRSGGRISRTPNWMPYVKNALYDYPEIHAEIEALRSTSMTANYTGMPNGGGVSDPVYQAVIRKGTLTEDDVRMHDAIEAAILQTKELKNWRVVLRLVKLVYWKQSHNVKGAARCVNYSDSRAKELLNNFVHLVAKKRGLE